jgi:hypothetical protein
MNDGLPPQSGGSVSMQVGGETYVDKDGVEKLRRIRFDSRQIEVAENIDQWHGKDYRYFKVKSRDGDLYILRRNSKRLGANDVRAQLRLRPALGN